MVKIRALAKGNEKGGKDTDAKSQVNHHLVLVKVLLAVTIIGVHREVRIWVAPRGIRVRVHCRSSRPTVADHPWDRGSTSRKRPDLDGVAPFVHDEIPTARKVERGAKGCVALKRVGEADPAPLVVFDGRVAISV